MNNNPQIQKAPKAFRTISEVAKDLKLQPYVIRFWESQFKQIKPMRKKGGRRYYRPRDIDFLKGLKYLLYENKFTIKKARDEIRKKGKSFVVSRNKSDHINLNMTNKKAISVNFSHQQELTLYINTKIGDAKKIQVNEIAKSLYKLKGQMLSRTTI